MSPYQITKRPSPSFAKGHHKHLFLNQNNQVALSKWWHVCDFESTRLRIRVLFALLSESDPESMNKLLKTQSIVMIWLRKFGWLNTIEVKSHFMFFFLNSKGFLSRTDEDKRWNFWCVFINKSKMTLFAQHFSCKTQVKVQKGKRMGFLHCCVGDCFWDLWKRKSELTRIKTHLSEYWKRLYCPFLMSHNSVLSYQFLELLWIIYQKLSINKKTKQVSLHFCVFFFFITSSLVLQKEKGSFVFAFVFV